MATVLLLGLDDPSADTIAKLSIQAGHSARREPMRTTWETRPAADLIILSGDCGNHIEALKALRQYHNALPVIVLSRLGEASDWIDALDAGATDFLTAPYSMRQISGAISSAMSRPKTAAA